ncbi:alpha/beta hydrolase domain-containing protein [Methylocystis sp. JAN1]|uniref:alpha/beta hydrolase domain-containing protein n=1 Tax=Methylocystis sp. JAN1 TaxID=3397211 RepID=UPI003FA1F204
MRRALFLLAVFVCIPAWAELLTLDEAEPELRASLKIGGKEYSLPVKLLRSAAAPRGDVLLVDVAQQSDLTDTALARGMSVATLDLGALPAPARAGALRDLLPRLREKSGATRILGRGAGPAAEALIEAGALFDGLLIHRAEPFAVPIDPRGPKIIETFGSEAYWRPGVAANETEAAEGANRRRFFIAGTAQAGAVNCAAPINSRASGPALRAMLVALDEWTKGMKPPASRAPRAHGAALVPAESLVWPKIPGLPQAPPGERLVPRIDADGNETSGLRLPDHVLPIATFTAFAAQKDRGGPFCAAGAAIPFASTRADREKTGDPRPSLIERYGSRAYFVATMRVVADKLVKERLLLKEDADAYVKAARQAPF